MPIHRNQCRALMTLGAVGARHPPNRRDVVGHTAAHPALPSSASASASRKQAVHRKTLPDTEFHRLSLIQIASDKAIIPAACARALLVRQEGGGRRGRLHPSCTAARGSRGDGSTWSLMPRGRREAPRRRRWRRRRQQGSAGAPPSPPCHSPWRTCPEGKTRYCGGPGWAGRGQTRKDRDRATWMERDCEHPRRSRTGQACDCPGGIRKS